MQIELFIPHISNADIDYGGPEHLKVRSIDHLNELLQEGLDSLDRGEGIKATDDWRE